MKILRAFPKTSCVLLLAAAFQIAAPAVAPTVFTVEAAPTVVPN